MNEVIKRIGMLRAAELPTAETPTPPHVIELKVVQQQPENIVAEVQAIKDQCSAIATTCTELQSVCASLRMDNSKLADSIAELSKVEPVEEKEVPQIDLSPLQAVIQSCVDAIAVQGELCKSLASRLDRIEQISNKPAVIPEPPEYDMVVVSRDLNQRTKNIRLTPIKR